MTELVVNIPLDKNIISYLLNSYLVRHLVNEAISSFKGPKEKGRKSEKLVGKETFYDILFCRFPLRVLLYF